MYLFIKILVIALIFAPWIGLAYLSLSNHFDFKFLCEKVATEEASLHELNSLSNLDGGDFNSFERQLRRRLMSNEFEFHLDREIARKAERFVKRTRLFYACFAAYVVAFAVFFLPLVSRHS